MGQRSADAQSGLACGSIPAVSRLFFRNKLTDLPAILTDDRAADLSIASPTPRLHPQKVQLASCCLHESPDVTSGDSFSF